MTIDAAPSSGVFEGLGVRAGDADLTVVQFSTAFCGPCRATKARLQQLQATRPGLAVVQVDAESHLDEVRELDVRRTPTLFYLDRRGALVGRSSGAPRPDELTALIDAHVDLSGWCSHRRERPSDGGQGASGRSGPASEGRTEAAADAAQVNCAARGQQDAHGARVADHGRALVCASTRAPRSSGRGAPLLRPSSRPCRSR